LLARRARLEDAAATERAQGRRRQWLLPEEALEILDALMAVYATEAFQRELRKAWDAAGQQHHKKVAAVKDICTWHTYPVVTSYGFKASAEGQREMLSRSQMALTKTPAAADKLYLLQWLQDPDQQAAQPLPPDVLRCLFSGEAPLSKAVSARVALSERYHRDGFVFPIFALGPGEVAEVLARVKHFQAEYQPRLKDDTSNAMNHVWLPWMRDLARNPAILSAVGEVLCTHSIYLWTSEFFARAPGKSQESSTGIGWHKDVLASHSRLTPIDRRHYVTVFVALTKCDRHHGCLLARPTRPGVKANGGGGEEVCLELEPGEVSLHGPSTPHTGGLNASDETRYAIALRYIRASTRDLDSESLGKNTALLVSGEDEKHNFDAMPELPEEGTDAGIELREKILLRRGMGGTFHSAWTYGMRFP